MRSIENMKITADKEEVLGILRNNRDRHSSIVAEAKDGYLEKAGIALEKRLQQLAEGKIVSLHFSLQVPLDHTNVYTTAIRMLELHQQAYIELSSSEVRNLIEDKWDWSERFYGVAAAYSKQADDIMKTEPFGHD